ncbi:hypothetical protein SLEP1_g4371 [Rubroshorea leprosula]|uniref:Retrotransposon gag domain-containing protein n=1 Tax=Rubroshorea leprosula TaxID=152421 RepID=A0AAV5HSU4_9ROSI|nr:hypothetical protein SLEP1_g4371 [Rubroshorea leprosula]
MRSFLKGRKLWRYITGDITLPQKVTGETDKKYVDRLEDWDSKNHQIITWFRNTSIPSIHLQFGRYETAKEVWDLLAARYTTSDLSSQYQLWEELHNLKQERGESITSFYAKMEAIWDQLALSEPTFNDTADIGKYIEYRDKMRLIQFLIVHGSKSSVVSLLVMFPSCVPSQHLPPCTCGIFVLVMPLLVSPSHRPPIFTNPSLELFPNDDAGSPNELSNDQTSMAPVSEDVSSADIAPTTNEIENPPVTSSSSHPTRKLL